MCQSRVLDPILQEVNDSLQMNNQSETIQVSITGLGHDGAGVGRADGLVIFVDGALPGETVTAQIFAQKKSFARATLLDIITPAGNRISPPCPYFAECGGCQLQHLAYSAQLESKTQRVRDAVSRIGKADPAVVRQCIGMDHPWEYRNNIQYAVSTTESIPHPGYMKKNSNQILTVDRCLLVEESFDKIAQQICRALSGEYQNIKKGDLKGLKRIQIRKSLFDDSHLIILETEDKPIGNGSDITGFMTHHFLPTDIRIAGIVNLTRKKSGPVIHEKIISGENHIIESLSGLLFRVQAQSFFQTNTRQAEILINTAVRLALNKQPVIHTSAIDAFCGTGSFALFLARQGISVTGLESNPRAINDAKENSILNNLTNTRFVTGAFSSRFPSLAGKTRATLLVTDPPRNGIGREGISGIRNTSIRDIVYISCDPETLARDIDLLSVEGFFPETIIPIDMFPQTAHIETVALIRRKHENTMIP